MKNLCLASIPLRLLAVLVLWLTIIFISFGLFAIPQRNCGRQLVRLRAVGFRRNLSDPRNVRALRRNDSDLQRSAARRPRASRTVGSSV